MNPEQWLSLKWNGGSTMSDRWLNQSKIIQKKHALIFKNYFYRGAIRMYEYFNDYENWVKATDWQ